MNKTKIFYGHDTKVLEEKMNKWLEENFGKIHILSTTQSCASSGISGGHDHFFILFLYKIEKEN